MLDRAHDISFNFVVPLEHICQVQAGELGRSLPPVAIENGKAGIIGVVLEILPRHKLYKHTQIMVRINQQ